MKRNILKGLVVTFILLIVLAAMPTFSKAAYGPEWDKIVDAAKKEGKITIYGFSAEQGADIQKTFGNKYGIKVEGIAALGSQLAERIKTEVSTGKVIADVFIGVINWHMVLRDAGAIQEYASKLPEWEMSKNSWKANPVLLDGHIVLTHGTPWSPGINTNLVKGADIPTSWLDLLDPKWNGKLVMDSPTLQGSIYWLYIVMPKMGLDRDDFFTKLGKNKPIVKSNVYEVWNTVKDGLASISISGYYQYVSQNRPAGAPVQITSPKEGWYVSGPAVSMIKNCPNPNAALLYLNWHMTEEGVQTVTEKTGSTMVLRKGLKDYFDPAGMAGPVLPSEKIIWLDPSVYAEQLKLQQSGLLEKMMGLPSLR